MSKHIHKIIIVLCFIALLAVTAIIAKRHFYPNTIGEFLGMRLKNPDSINVVYGNTGNGITIPNTDKADFISNLCSIHVKRLKPNDSYG